MRLLLFLFFLLLVGKSNSQNNFNYILTINDSLTYFNQYKQIESRYKMEVETLPKENKKYYVDIYKDRFDAIKDYFLENNSTQTVKLILTYKP